LKKLIRANKKKSALAKSALKTIAENHIDEFSIVKDIMLNRSTEAVQSSSKQV
jgi:hypothetical protein